MRQNDRVEEQRLISRAKEGDMDAFERLVKTHQQAIYRLCRRMTGRHQLADDVAQETFIKAYFALPSFRDGLNFFSWIRKIAVNTTLNHLKSVKREEPLRERDSAVTAQPQDELQEHEIRHKVEKAVEALPSEQKAVFVLRIQESLSYREIAETLRISEGTVMSRLHRARHKLKEALAEDMGWRRA